MPDEKPVPQTLETIARKIDALDHSVNGRIDALDRSVNERLAQMDGKMERGFAETKAQLRAEIEALDERMKAGFDAVIAQQQINETLQRAQARAEKRVDDHDLRILALEHRKAPKR